MAHLLERTIFIGLSYLLNNVLEIYDTEVFARFSSPRGFPRINVVYLVIVFLLVILHMLLLSSKLKRSLIAALKLRCVSILLLLIG